MSDYAKRLHEQRLNLVSQMRAITDTAETEKRDMTAEEDGNWLRANADLKALDERLADVLDSERRAAEVQAAFDAVERRPQERKSTEQSKVGEEIRSFLRGEKASIEIAPDTKFRDLSKGTATAGGNLVPTTFYGQLIEHMIDMSAILTAGPTVLETASGETIDIPITTSFSSGTLTAENAAITESDPAFGKRSLGAYKYGVIVQAPRELVDDAGVDLEGFLARQCGWAVGNTFGADLVTGNGSSKPSGIVQTASTGVTGGAGVTGAFTADNLIDLYWSVIAPYRKSPSCGWIMRDATMAAVRKLKDTTNQYLWQPSMQLGAPDILLGKPVHTDPNVAAVGLSAKSVIFGDISRYFVRIAGGVRFERSTDFAFNTDQITFKAVVRGDGLLVDQTGAVKVFVGNAA